MVTQRILTSIRFFSFVKLRKQDRSIMNKAYFRHTVGEDQFNISFLFTSEETNINRQFNFSRKLAENVSTLLCRISTNVEKVIQKKSKKNKKKAEGVSKNEKPVVRLLENEETIPGDESCSEIFGVKYSNVKLKIIDTVYDVIINAPHVASLSLPTSLLCGFPVYPTGFKMEFANKKHSKFTWYHSLPKLSDQCVQDDCNSWLAVGQGVAYTPSERDIGLKLKLRCEPGNEVMQGPATDVISTTCVEAGPGNCPFETRHSFTKTALSGKNFRVVSYNILADLYCDSDFTRTVLHPYCPSYALHIDYRKQLIIKEILGYNADIVCLQEVDSKVFNHELRDVLEETGPFAGVFTRKGKLVAEGLACFYRRERFSLHQSHSIVFAEELHTAPYFSKIWNAIKDNMQLVDRVKDRSTAGQATVLRSLDNPKEILVIGNMHLYFHPDADHIRLIQGGMAIFWLQDILKRVQDEFPGCRASLMICGDFNSTPSSGIYKLYTTGEAGRDLEDWKSNAEEAVSGLSLDQPILMGSACGTPEYTNFTVGFADCLDYIYYEKNSFNVEQVIPFPSTEELKEHTALPSVVFPSDHISIVADLSFVEK